jgi:hypothetical protein
VITILLEFSFTMNPPYAPLGIFPFLFFWIEDGTSTTGRVGVLAIPMSSLIPCEQPHESQNQFWFDRHDTALPVSV